MEFAESSEEPVIRKLIRRNAAKVLDVWEMVVHNSASSLLLGRGAEAGLKVFVVCLPVCVSVLRIKAGCGFAASSVV
jgi:hypothetical protein